MEEKISFEVLKGYFPTGSTQSYPKDYVICDIHRKVKTFRWLLEGSIDYYISVENPENDILVNNCSEPFTTIGLNGFNSRKRYTYKAIVSSPKAVFFEVPLIELKDYIKHDGENTLLKGIGVKLYHQLRTALLKQTELLSPVRFQPFVEDREFYVSPDTEQTEIVALMRRSPFLDYFEEKYLTHMAKIAERREYEPDEILYIQEGSSNGLFILIEGEVSIKRIENNIEIQQRSIKNSGFIYGWSSLLGEKDICSAITTTKTSAYFIPQLEFAQLFDSDKSFEKQFFKQLLWLMGNQLNAAFVRYVGLLGKHNLQAVYQLINNNKSRIALSSPLHQVPHLLKNINTKPYAYRVLSEILNTGSSLERHLASLSLELLAEDKKELNFVKGLQHVYETVAEKNSEDAMSNRRACAEITTKVFDNVPHLIEGWENLPEDSGHVFIYNHLINDSYYTLNNSFQITLDSHFLSSLVLYKKYGEPGIRTVRVGKGQEYGHQNYYDNLGYINVYTKESDETSREEKLASRSIFYSQASKHLQDKYNLIISPEGTSYRTEDSPGPFKLGTFKLALYSDPEPFIVPVVMVNFDHRIGKSLYYCSIKKPFKLSEKVPSRKIEDLVRFVNEYQEKYKQYVKDAISRAEHLFMSPTDTEDLKEPPEIWRNEIKRLRRRVGKLTDQENLIAFYGSSSIRLWVNMQRDLEPINVLNLGFGGSSFAWCIHYFEEVFKDVHPSKIVLYAGENDLSEGRAPQEVLADCKELVHMIYNRYPSIELALISLKPSVEREALIPLIMETNLLLSKYMITELNAQYINVFGQMITTENRPIPELYMSDGLHLNKRGYALWSGAIKKALQSVDNLEMENQL